MAPGVNLAMPSERVYVKEMVMTDHGSPLLFGGGKNTCVVLKYESN
jgi:hypothetical protein